jgi:DNA-binding NtrC family response regulator
MATGNHTLLLIDDDKHHNEMLASYLKQKYRLSIHSFSTGEEAMAKMDELNPSFIILDYYLDKENREAKNGLEILKMIKEKYPDMYVIMLSGQDKIEVAVDIMKYGAYDYVIKNPSGFMRVENVLKNINHNLYLKSMAKTYRFATYFLSSVIVLIIVMAIVLRVLGISTDSIGW